MEITGAVWHGNAPRKGISCLAGGRGNPLNEIDVEFLTSDPRIAYFTLHHVTIKVEYATRPVRCLPTLPKRFRPRPGGIESRYLQSKTVYGCKRLKEPDYLPWRFPAGPERGYRKPGAFVAYGSPGSRDPAGTIALSAKEDAASSDSGLDAPIVRFDSWTSFP